jgi:hypothetical protein
MDLRDIGEHVADRMAELAALKDWRATMTAIMCLVHHGGVAFDDAPALLKADMAELEALKARTCQTCRFQETGDIYAWCIGLSHISGSEVDIPCNSVGHACGSWAAKGGA